jgi:hypothetical protein
MTPEDMQRFQQAVAVAQTGQRPQAHAILDNLHRIYPQNADVLLWYAFTTDNPEVARYAVERAEFLAPGNPSVLQARAWLNTWIATPHGNLGYSYHQTVNTNNYSHSQQNYGFSDLNESIRYSEWQGSSDNGWSSGQRLEYTVSFGNGDKPGLLDRLGLGGAFIKSATAMVRDDFNLIKPMLYAFLWNIVATLFVAIPLILGAALTRVSALYYVAAFLAAVLSYFIFYHHTAMTAKLVHQRLTTGQTNMAEARAAAREKRGSIMMVALVSAFLSTIRMIVSAIRRQEGGVAGWILAAVTELVLGVIEAVWTFYTFFVIPIIMLEHRDMGDAVKRSTYIIKNNFLQVGVSAIGVGLVTGIISILSTFFFIGSAFITYGLLQPLNVGLAFTAAILIVVVGVSLVSIFLSYLRTAYYTMLVMWATANEKQGMQTVPPAPLHNAFVKRGYATA